MFKSSAYLSASIPALKLPPALRSECEEQMRTASPREACGLLLGERTDAVHVVTKIAPIPNVALAEDAFRLDPIAWRKAELAARQAGLLVLGVWHSHPSSNAKPSARDSRGAQEGWSHLICATQGEQKLRSFYSQDGRLLEQELH